MNKIIVRQAEVQDAEALLEFLMQVGCESDQLLFGAEDFKGASIQDEQFAIMQILSSRNSTMFIAQDEDKIVGMITLIGKRRDRVAHQGEMSISILKEYWGAGIGSYLMRAMIDFAKDNQIEIIRLEVFEDNLRARNMYEKFDFEEVGYVRNYSKLDGYYKHAVLMALYL